MQLKHAAAALGLLIWTAVALIGGRSEAWDSPLYWQAGLPALMLGAGFFGYKTPQRSVMLGWWVGCGQGLGILSSIFLSGHDLGLWPLSIIAGLLFSLPCLLGAYIGGLVAKRRAPS